MNALKMLQKDHAEVMNLFAKLDRTGKTDHEKRSSLFGQLRRALQIHTKAEEEIFYPALKALNGEGRSLISQALKEHREVDELLTQMSRLKPHDKKFEEKFETLVENVEHHIQEEEGEIFQFAEENCSAQELDDLGHELEERKRILDQRLAA
jgi:hemerythrin superfamily protein